MVIVCYSDLSLFVVCFWRGFHPHFAMYLTVSHLFLGGFPYSAASCDSTGREIFLRGDDRRGSCVQVKMDDWKWRCAKTLCDMAILCYLIIIYDAILCYFEIPDGIWSELLQCILQLSPVPGEKSGWTPRSCARAKAKTLGTSGLGSLECGNGADSRSPWIFQVMCQVMCQVMSGIHVSALWNWDILGLFQHDGYEGKYIHGAIHKLHLSEDESWGLLEVAIFNRPSIHCISLRLLHEITVKYLDWVFIPMVWALPGPFYPKNVACILFPKNLLVGILYGFEPPHRS